MPIRQCLVMHVIYGDNHYLQATLFGPDFVTKVVSGVTGECSEKIIHSSATEILLVFLPILM